MVMLVLRKSSNDDVWVKRCVAASSVGLAARVAYRFGHMSSRGGWPRERPEGLTTSMASVLGRKCGSRVDHKGGLGLVTSVAVNISTT